VDDSKLLTPDCEFLTQDPAMQNLLQMVAKIAPTEVTALIQGESGTGKELIAKRIHQLSSRRSKNLVSINCGAIQDTLLLSELFGHEKGAFTGAVQQKKGLVEVAHEGTLFLDEIGEMGMEAQAKLLRFLQEGEIFRVGGKSSIKVNVRVISATNKDLETAVKRGQFREDLYYRINTVTLRIAPLRKRPGDIPLLINQFLSKSGIGNSPVRSVSPKAMELLKRYHWPGNVRELQNTVERFKILVDSEVISDNDIPFNIRNPEIETDYFDGASTFLLSQIEKRHILRVLSHFRGNKTKAANAMGITVKTLYNKLALYEKERQEEADKIADIPRPSRPSPSSGLSSPSPEIG
jgi:transcriptional regulator with PAS, ATPase and Fis domain